MPQSKSLSAALALLTACAAFTAPTAQAARRSPLADKISRMIEESVTYPSYAFAQNIEEGDVLVSFLVASTGQTQDIQVLESSGSRKLDCAVVHAVAGLHNLPQAAMGKHIVSAMRFRNDGVDASADAEAAGRPAVSYVVKRWPNVLARGGYGAPGGGGSDWHGVVC